LVRLIDPYQKQPAACREYDPRFSEVAQRLAEAIQARAPEARVEHIGSTAVPGCAGKGVIDLQVLYPSGGLSAVKEGLADLGFQAQAGWDPFPEDRPMREGTIEHHGTTYNVHAHVIAQDDPEAERNRAFRDLLRFDADLRDGYVRRKREILAGNPVDSLDYSIAKGPYIRGVLTDHGIEVPREIVIRRTRPDDFPATLAIYNSLRPWRPAMTLEEYNHHLHELEGKRYEAFVADLDGQIVGDFDLFEASWYGRPDTFLLYGEVREDFRGRGIGSRLHTTMERRARAIGARRIYTEVIDTVPEATAFLEHRGWGRTGREDRPSRLTVADANLAGFTDVEERLRGEGIQIRTLAEIGTEDEAFMHALHEMEFRAEQDMPSSEPHAKDPYETWLQRQMEGPGRSPETFWVALEGNAPVGVARLRQMAGGAVGNGFTGVDPDYRGRGIARALKLKTIEWAREQHVGYIYTANDAENRRMLAINISLGYQPLPADIELVKEIAD
jgi:GrpB-like predicted nucleotidyltransferase (UPF0157 family)/GNAT superfamily N-acetyltransferase